MHCNEVQPRRRHRRNLAELSRMEAALSSLVEACYVGHGKVSCSLKPALFSSLDGRLA